MIVRGRIVVPGKPGVRRRVMAKNGSTTLAAPLFAGLDTSVTLANNILEFGPGEYFKTVFVDPALIFVDDPDTGRTIGDGRGERVLARAWFDISDTEFGGKNGTNCGAAINKALVAAESITGGINGNEFGGGGVMLPAWDKITVDESLRVGVRSILSGASLSFASRLRRHADLYGPGINCWVSELFAKSQNPPQPRIQNLFWDGREIGQVNFIGQSIAGSPDIINVNAGVVAAARLGDIACFWGFPFPSYVVAKSGTTLTLNTPALRSSVGVLTKSSGRLWEGYRKTCQPIAAGSYFVTCNTDGVRVGMRADATPFGAVDDPGDDGEDGTPVDSDDIVAQNAMVKSITPGVGVELDLPAASSSGGAPFVIQFRRYDDFIYVPALKSYSGPTDPSNKKAIGPIIENVTCQYNNGPAVRTRPGRNSTRVLGGKQTNNGAGTLMGSCSDSEVSGLAVGVNRLYGFRMATQATANASDLENYQCIRTDIAADGEIYKCPTSHLFGGEGYNGTYRIYGGGVAKPGVHRVGGVAFRHHQSSNLEDDTLPGFIQVFGAAHVDIGAGVSFEPDQPKNSKPSHIVYFGPNNTSSSANLATDTWLDTNDARCPFRIAVTDKPAQLVSRIFDRTSRQIIESGPRLFSGRAAFSGVTAQATGQTITMSVNGGTATVARNISTVNVARGTPSTGYNLRMPPAPQDGDDLHIHFFQACTNMAWLANGNEIAQRFVDEARMPVNIPLGAHLHLRWMAEPPDGVTQLDDSEPPVAVPVPGWVIITYSGTQTIEPPDGEDGEPPTLDSFSSYRTTPTSKSWVGIDWGTMFGIGPWNEPSLPPADRVLYPVFDLDLPPEPPEYYGWTDGYPLCIRAHPAAVLKDIGPTLDAELKQRKLAEGIAFANTEFAHPGVSPTYLDGSPVDYDDAGRMIQFLRSLDVAFNLDQTKFGVVAQSRGNWLNVTSMRPTLKNPAGPTYVSRQDSFCTLHMNANSQTVYNTRRGFDKFCLPNSPKPLEADNRADFYEEFGAPDELIPNPIDMIATAPQVPAFVTSYDGAYPGGKVPWTSINTQHWPHSGQLLIEEFENLGRQEDLVVWDASGGVGIAEQLGAYAVAAAEYWRGAKLYDAMATGFARRWGHAAIGIRPNLAGLYQDNVGTTSVTTAGQPIGGVVDMASGVLNTKVVAPSTFLPSSGGYGVGTPGGQTTSAQRTTLAATAGGYGFAVVPTQRVLIGYAGASNDGRQGRSWTLTNRYDTPALLPAGAIGFGTAQANNETVVLMVAAPLGTNITDQHRKVYDFAAYARRNAWPAPVL